MDSNKIFLVAIGFISIAVFIISLAEVSSVSDDSNFFSYDMSAGCPDRDNDEICDVFDLCPNSKSYSKVDSRGCDISQFCEKFYCSLNCFYADFMNDEPQEKNPGDCTLVVLNKEGKYYPKCIPLQCYRDPKNLSLKLPDEAIHVLINFSGFNSYFKTTLFNVSSGYSVNNSNYPAWCVDEDHGINHNLIYEAKLYSSYDPNLSIKCPYCNTSNLDKVNYILNHKQGSVFDIQSAIWYFIDHGIYPTDQHAIAMVEEAKLYGNGFVPGKGEIMAVLVNIGKWSQTTIIEIDP